jgi:hypothetical protein
VKSLSNEVCRVVGGKELCVCNRVCVCVMVSGVGV